MVGLAVQAAAARAETPVLHIDHAAARVVVIPEARSDISVYVSRGDTRLPPLSVRQDGGAIIVDGGLMMHWLTCSGGDGPLNTRRVNVSGVGSVKVGALPVITVHAPRAVAVVTGGAVWGEVGASDALSLDAGGCGDWRVAAVRGKLKVHIAGSGDVQGDTVGALDLGVAGSGDLRLHSVAGLAQVEVAGSGGAHLGSVAGPLSAQLAGSGDLFADQVNGAIKAQLSGSSDMKINGGHAPQIAVQVSGSGEFRFNGAAGSVSAAVSGSGDVHVAHADGPVSKSVSGSGDITIGR
jgi:hypothetical protein